MKVGTRAVFVTRDSVASLTLRSSLGLTLPVFPGGDPS